MSIQDIRVCLFENYFIFQFYAIYFNRNSLIKDVTKKQYKIFIKYMWQPYCFLLNLVAQSAVAVEYTGCFSAEG